MQSSRKDDALLQLWRRLRLIDSRKSVAQGSRLPLSALPSYTSGIRPNALQEKQLGLRP